MAGGIRLFDGAVTGNVPRYGEQRPNAVIAWLKIGRPW
jgi:hypothetical protein